jgi:hypothetical protein
LRAQYHHRQETALAWRIKQTRLPEAWTIESFPFKRQPGVNPKQIRALADLEFVAKAENLVFIGQTGVGKTGLASGLLLKAIQNGYRGRFVRAQDLFDEMYASLADRSTRRLLNTLIRIDVLHIDELGYLNLKPEQTNIFFKLMEERYRRKPTIITTNLDSRNGKRFSATKRSSSPPQSVAPSVPHHPDRRSLPARSPRLIPTPATGVDADVPVDAQNAPTATCKTAQNAVSHKRPHPSSDSWKDEQRKDPTLAAHGVIPITDRDLSLGHFSRAEVGQLWRASRIGRAIAARSRV